MHFKFTKPRHDPNRSGNVMFGEHRAYGLAATVVHRQTDVLPSTDFSVSSTQKTWIFTTQRVRIIYLLHCRIKMIHVSGVIAV